MTEERHARFSPSKLPRIIQCPGSVKMCENVPRMPSSSDAQEGTYLHSVVEDYLTRDEYSVSTVLHKDPLKHVEFRDAVEEILDWVFALKAQHSGQETTEMIETRLSCKDFEEHTGCSLLDEVEGTVDYIFSVNRILYVCDWKFGKGIIVDPSSSQLLGYTAGALKSPANAEKYDKVVCVIGQPRGHNEDHFRQTEYTVPEVLRWIKHTLSPALQETLADYPILRPSVDACRWCDVKMTCRARLAMANEIASQVFKIYAEIPDRVPLAELSEFLVKAPVLESYIKDINNYAFNIIIAGGEVPDHKVVRGRSNRTWENETVARQVLEEHGYDVSELSEVKFFGPAKVEKVLSKADRQAEFFKNLIIKPEGKLTLANVSDKREPVKFQTAEEVFANLAITED